MEQHIGHRTFYENVRRFVDADSRIEATWFEITYDQPDSFWGKLPLLPNGLRGTMMGREQVRRGLRQTEQAVAVFNTQVPAALASSLVQKRPYFLCTDITPLQYDRMGHHYGHDADDGGLFGRYKHRVNERLFQGATRLLPWSSWTAESLVEEYGADPKRVEILPPGVDVDKWQVGHGSEDGPVRILFVGGDFYRKGGELLLRAFERLAAGSAELVLVTRSTLEARPGVSVHHGLKPNSAKLLALYQSCDIFVLPTSAEAFGIAAVEASASGLPVVATNVGGLVDIVGQGETGFLIEDGDVDALADRLNLLVGDKALRRRLGEAARRRVEERFDARRNAARLIELLQQTVEQ